MKFRLSLLLLCLWCGVGVAAAQPQRSHAATAERQDAEFGPVVSAYLGYLQAEQEVVDDRASRHQISQAYYRRNSNRIRALRRMTVQIARETRNDFVPELYAVAADEFGTLFDPRPDAKTFHVGEIINDTFRYLGAVRSAENFYLFARLDIYEQAELLKKREDVPPPATTVPAVVAPSARGTAVTRPRRATTP